MKEPQRIEGDETELSVVLACDGAIDSLQDRVDAIERACARVKCEILVVHAEDVIVPTANTETVTLRFIAVPSRLVPVMWGKGVSFANGKIVALTTTQFRVHANWAEAFIRRLAQGDLAGAGGRMVISPRAGRLTRAAFLIRYSEHMGDGNSSLPADIPGDNAAYLRQDVIGSYPQIEDGFWEIDAHRLMRQAGKRFGRTAEAVAEFEPAFSFSEMIANRFIHGSHFGAYRVRELGWPRWRAVAVTPLVPAVLLTRIIGRVRRTQKTVRHAIGPLPWMLVLLAAWAAGEASGAMRAPSRPPKLG